MYKILWFTNTPCSAIERLQLGHNKGGWLMTLEQELVKYKEIELHVGFYHTKKMDPFIHKNTQFYPIMRKYSSSKLQRYLARLFGYDNQDKLEIQELINIIKKINPDLIHVHGTEENFGLIQYHTQIPVVISIQGVLSSCVEKLFSGIPSNMAQKYGSLKSKILVKSAKYEYKSFRDKSFREQIILQNCKYIIGRTDLDRRVTQVLAPKSQYFTSQEMLRPYFYSNSWNKQNFDKKIRIITISSNGIYKGFETIVKTAKTLVKYSNLDFEWLVIGLQKESEIVLLTEKWLKVKINDIPIKLLGEKNQTEIIDILRSADIYCQVSHIENSPNSLCEAMMLGIPIIASYAGGTSSLLENDKAGILVQDGDPFALAGAILELYNNFDKAKELANNAKISALIRHDKHAIAKDLIKTYQKIIEREAKI